MTERDPIDKLFEFANDSFSVALALPPWEIAMRACFRFELEVRLTVGRKRPADSVALDIGDKHYKGNPRPGLLSLLFEQYEFSPKEQEFIRKCNTLRNKLIHCEPDKVQELAMELARGFSPQNLVTNIPIPDDASGADVKRILTNLEGASPVRNTTARDQGFFGWMLQAAGDGTFSVAAGAIAHATRIIHERTKDEGGR